MMMMMISTRKPLHWEHISKAHAMASEATAFRLGSRMLGSFLLNKVGKMMKMMTETSRKDQTNDDDLVGFRFTLVFWMCFKRMPLQLGISHHPKQGNCD